MQKPIFKESKQGQSCLFPVSLEEKIPANSPARLVNHIVDNLDIINIIDTYKGGGSSAYHPRMLLKVVIYAYLNNIYSCRKIDKNNCENINYMWLSGMQEPDYRTINRFRSEHLKEHINHIFTQVVLMLVDMGCLTLNTIYIDGTKMESRANRYTFVWRKSVEKNKAKLEAKIKIIIEQIDECIAQDNQPDEEPPTLINSEELKKRIAKINEKNSQKELSKAEKKSVEKAVNMLKKKYLPKLEEYEKKLETLGERNSYSKTDPDATFMRMKDDRMQNGQLKPAYNLQIGTENQIITHYQFFPNPADFHTFIPFNENFRKRYGKLSETETADAGYGNEENYEYAENNNIEAFIKYPGFHAEQKKKFRENIFITQNLFYNEKNDYFVCPMGQHLEKQYITDKINTSGYVSKITVYTARNCEGCPLRCLCFKAKGNRTIEINHHLRRLKNQARELLHSEEGIEHRKRRSVEPEPVFSHIRYDGQYLRFRHFGQPKIEMDFGIFDIALNISKGHKKQQKKSKSPHCGSDAALKMQISCIGFSAVLKNRSTEIYPLKRAA